MSIQQILDAQQRLVILRSLLDIGGAANESILNDCLDQLGTGRVTRQRVGQRCPASRSPERRIKHGRETDPRPRQQGVAAA
ncbi:MAG: hypothetical protein ACRDAR_00235 [Aeromonas veronii]